MLASSVGWAFMNRTGVLLLLGSLLLAAGGCGKKDKVVGPSDQPVPQPYPVRSTPQNALLYYKAAWENRDSTRVDSVLADDYAGASTDLSGTSTFSKADEIRIMRRMHEDPNVTGVVVDLRNPATWIRQSYAGDPPDWIALDLPSPRIEVFYVFDEILADQSTFMEFKFRPASPARASPTDTLWSIVRWTELAQ